MQLIPTFSTLLSSILLAASLPTHIYAAPTTRNAPPHDLTSNTTHLFARVPPQQAPQQPPPAILLPLAIIGLDELYYTQLSIGTNPRPFNLVVDSGSQTFWVNDETQPNLGNKNSIGPHRSTTLRQLQPPRTWSTTYSDGGSVAGTVVFDNVNIRGAAILPNFPFGTGQRLTGLIGTVGEDGMIGFGVGPSPHTGGLTLVEALATAGLIPAAISGWKLPRHADGGQGGELVLGGVNPASFVPPLTTVPADLTAGDYRFRIDNVFVQRRQAIGARTGIIDCGANEITMPVADAAAFHTPITGAIPLSDGNFLIPCNSRAVVIFTIGGKGWPVRTSDLVGDAFTHPQVPPGMCRSLVAAANTQVVLVGSPFLKNVYHVLDRDGRSVSFAALR
ncbi:acid protease [Dentipellis sp. KUC8613]|nr:acid protease [Dentipellis sp. KUC8613]